jgi:hypothetical protein
MTLINRVETFGKMVAAEEELVQSPWVIKSEEIDVCLVAIVLLRVDA